MNEMIDAIMGVQTWPQVIVILGGLAYLAYRAHVDGKKVANIENKATIAAHQVVNNGGGSMRDAIDRLESMVTAHISDAEADTARIVELEKAAERHRAEQGHDVG